MEFRLLVKVGSNDREAGIMWMDVVDPTSGGIRVSKPATLQWRATGMLTWIDVPIEMESGHVTINAPTLGAAGEVLPTRGHVVVTVR